MTKAFLVSLVYLFLSCWLGEPEPKRLGDSCYVARVSASDLHDVER